MAINTTIDEGAVVAPVPADETSAAVEAAPGRFAWLWQPVNVFLLLCALLPLVFVISFVTDRGVEMPLLDDWENAAIIAVKTADGTLTLNDLFRQYVSHRMVLTNIYTAIMTVLANWSIKFTLYFIVFQATLCLAMLGALFAKDTPRAMPAVLVAFSVLIFSVRQNINWLLSTQTSWFFVLIFFLAALVVLRFMRPGWPAVILAALLSVCGVFSTLHGFAALPVLFVFMWLRGYRQPKYFIFWAVVALAATAIFLIGYDLSMGAPEDMVDGLSREPYRIPIYIFTYFGNPFVIVDGDLWPMAAVIGVTGLILLIVNAAFVYRRRGIAPVAPWLVIGMWAVTSAILTSIGRGHYFPDPNPRHPLLDRYVLPSSFLWFAIIALVTLALREISHEWRNGKHRLLMLVNSISMVTLIGLFGWTTLWSYDLPPFLTQNELECMRRFPATRNLGCLTSSILNTIDREELLGSLNGMAAHQLSGFRDQEPPYLAYYRLDTLPRDTREEREGTRFSFFDFEPGLTRNIFYQAAPSISRFRITLPETDNPLLFFSAIYVNVPEEAADRNPDGVMFRVAIQPVEGDLRMLGESVFDPQNGDALQPITYRLDTYRGQTVDLILQADERSNMTADNAMWVDPGVLVLPAEPVTE